jgi:hydrogenase assembly chaperone HypC/HupF
MCLGFPGRVVAIDRAGATIDTEGRRRRASTLLLPDLEIGEWVWVAAGTVVERVPPGDVDDIRMTLQAAIAADASGTPGPGEGQVPS